MILLEVGNKVLAETVAAKIKWDPKEKREAIDVRLCDFDEVAYRVFVDPEARSILLVSISLPCWNEIKDNGGADSFETTYKGLVDAEPQSGFDVTLKIDLDNLTQSPDDLIKNISMLKTNLVGGVFGRQLKAVAGGSPGAPFKFTLRSDTTIFFFPGQDRCTIIYQIDFVERVDLAVAKVFLQEFVESRRHLGAAPPCAFYVNPPAELKHYGIVDPVGKLGFLSFALLKNHLDKPEKVDRCVASLQMFRNYLQYHIKCSKSHFHSRMRARVRNLLKVLNRAKTDQDDNAPKKTITGKTFVRKV